MYVTNIVRQSYLHEIEREKKKLDEEIGNFHDKGQICAIFFSGQSVKEGKKKHLNLHLYVIFMMSRGILV